MADPLVLFRWLDVVLVVLAAPFVVLLDLPVLGYAVGAARVDRQRGVGVWSSASPPRRTTSAAPSASTSAHSSARSWLMGLTILAVGLAAEREDGLTAAILVLAAFTVYFATSLILRPLEEEAPRP